MGALCDELGTRIHSDVRGLVEWEKLRVGCSTATMMAEPFEPGNLKTSRCEPAHAQAEPVEPETSRGRGARLTVEFILMFGIGECITRFMFPVWCEAEETVWKPRHILHLRREARTRGAGQN